MRFSRAEDVLKARSLNISRRGIFLTTDQIKPIGTPVRLSMEIDEEQERLEVAGIVIHEVPEAEEGKPRGVGIFLTKVPVTWDAFCEKLEKVRLNFATTS